MIKNIIVLVVLATFVASPIQAYPSLPCTIAQVDQLTPDTKNCTRFYECTLHGWVGNACNPGLEFNPEKLYCDYPENVKCATETPVERNDLNLQPCIELDQLIPDPQNCSRFYECSLQGWVGFACYPGLEFNPVTKQCDYPENVNCPNNNENLNLEPWTQLIPDPQNCSRFYACARQGCTRFDCYPGLEFNPVTTQCDYPENVNCTINNNDIPERASVKNEPCIIVDQLKPDVKNCSRFYECVEAGYWVGEPCNVGLLFNPDTLQCDYPENVKCATDNVPDIKPPCGTENYNAMFPDPLNCNGYLLCTPSGLENVSCPANLRFNPVTLSCDWSWKVTC